MRPGIKKAPSGRRGLAAKKLYAGARTVRIREVKGSHPDEVRHKQQIRICRKAGSDSFFAAASRRCVAPAALLRYLISCSKPRNSSELKNSSMVIPMPSHSFLMVEMVAL